MMEFGTNGGGRRVERTLIRGESRYREVVDNLKEVVFQTDALGHWVFLNRAWEETTGFDVKESLGRVFFEFVHPDDRQRNLELFEPLIRREKDYCRHEIRYLTREGGFRWIEVFARLGLNDKDEIVGTYGTLMDITERKQSEERLRAATTFRDSIIEHAAQGLSVCHEIPDEPHIHFTMWNRRMEEITGYTMEKINQLGWYQSVYPDPEVQERARERMIRMRVGDDLQGEEWEITRADGEKRTLQITTTCLESPDAQVHVLALMEDVTARKRAVDALRKSESRYREVVDNLKEVVFQTDALGHWVFLNRAWEETTGFDVKESLGRVFFEFVHPDDRQRNLELFEPLIRREKDYCRHEIRYLTREGGFRWIEVFARLGLNDKDEIVGTYGTLMDITERKQAEENRLNMERRFQQTQKLESLGVLAGGIAHDFNNLLMAILGNSEMAMMKLPPTSPVHMELQEVRTATQRASDLCRQMLAYSGRGRFEVKSVDLGNLVEEMVHLLKTSISKKANLKLNLQRELPRIHADASQMQQIVMNLIINATEALGEESGDVAVSTGVRICSAEYLAGAHLGAERTPGPYVYLEVADTGCGMGGETLQRMFEPFFTTKFMGRGLGMAAVLGIIRGHHGAIVVDSTPGKGTTFTALFPVVQEAREPVDSSFDQPVCPWQGRGTVLLVDDEASVRNVTAQFLKTLGFSILTASDGCEALEIFRERGDGIEFVVLDMTMPRMDGVGAFRELRGIRPDVRIILCSGYSEEEILSRFEGQQFVGALQKPYTFSKLANEVRRILDMA